MTRANDAQGSITLRMEDAICGLIEQAAETLGKSRAEFMVDTARRHAIDVLLDRRLFALDPEAHDSFVARLDAPPEPGPRLRTLMGRKPAWQRPT